MMNFAVHYGSTDIGTLRCKVKVGSMGICVLEQVDHPTGEQNVSNFSSKITNVFNV